MLEVRFYDEVEDALLKCAVIAAREAGKWIFCQHRLRDTWEIPGGRREPGETILAAAHRELREETGAADYSLRPVCVSSVWDGERETYGMLYAADIRSREPELHSEIAQAVAMDTLPERWTYPLIHPKLLEEVVRRGL